MIKATDDYKNQRLQLLMEAVCNDRLEGEVCPNCFELYSVPILRRFHTPILVPRQPKRGEMRAIKDAISQLRGIKTQSILKRASSDDLVNEYICPSCNRKYLGELDLVANQAETKVLSFFGYDTDRIYEKDFYPFSVLDDSYGSFVKNLWDKGVAETLTPRSMIDDIEDVITGKVLAQLTTFFREFIRVVYEDMGASVRVYSESHAGKIESGRGSSLPPSGADFAMWVGPLTKEDALNIEAYENGIAGFEQLPVKVGNGAIFQAKKLENGVIDKDQVNDLVKYASINYKDHEYYGIPGKLFINYTSEAPFVRILTCDFTYSLFNGALLEHKKTITVRKALTSLSEFATETTLTEFVQSYLSGKTGTPLLMLQDVLGTPGPKLVVGLPPDPLRESSPSGQALSTIVDGWCKALGKRLAQIEAENAAVAEQRAQQVQMRCRG